MADLSRGDTSERNEEIMRATYRALQDHGYADLTIQRIADEYGKSTAAIHYHYDTKEYLLAAFLDYVLERFVETIHEVETTHPVDRLNLLLDKTLLTPRDHRDLLVAILEMRSEAPYNDTFRERFQENDEYIRYMLRTVINDGIAEGVFVEADADQVARALMTIVDGARTRAVVHDDIDALTAARRTAEEYVDAVLQPESGGDDGD